MHIVITQGNARALIARYAPASFGVIILDPPAEIRDVLGARGPFETFSHTLTGDGVAYVLSNPDHGYYTFRGGDVSYTEDERLAPSPGYGHPAVRPLEAIQRLLNDTQGRVLDPYCGSGTTLLGAGLAGRDAVGFEIQPSYVEAAMQRLNTAGLSDCISGR